MPQAGRRAHEAAIERAGIVYMTEDRSKSPDAASGQIGAAFYRYTPDAARRRRRRSTQTSGPLEALAIKGEPRKDMD